MPKATSRKLRAFEDHGFVEQGETEGQVYGRCPFTGKDGKFYINKENLLWDSKVAGLSGNFEQFLERISERNVERLKRRQLARLEEHRGLPPEAYKPWKLGWDGQQFTMPVRNAQGKIVDIRRWKPGDRLRSTTGCATGLLGHELIGSDTSVPIYLCEGEWDAMALRWLFTQQQRKHRRGIVVGVPGATSFKSDWVNSFYKRAVYVLYDNDEAGEDGEVQIRKRLEDVAAQIAYIHWPAAFPLKADVRDWVISGAIKREIPRKCWRSLAELFYDSPRKETHRGTARINPVRGVRQTPKSRYKEAPSFEQVCREYERWLEMRGDYGALEVAMATVIAHEMMGDPIWMFLVGPPGSAKSEIISAFQTDDKIIHTSSITPHALCSGANMNPDPSLIPRLDGNVLVVKDFTAILALREAERQEIFGILRDAYDGSFSKVFGNGVTRSYRSRFGVLSGVTPEIYQSLSRQAQLGERFIKYLISDNLRHEDEEAILDRAMQNVNRETQMRQDLQDVTSAFLEGCRKRIHAPDESVIEPEIPAEWAEKIKAVAQVGAWMRGSVPRDDYRWEQMVGRPVKEIASRLTKQLAKLGLALAMVRGQDKVGAEQYRVLKKVILDTVDQRREEVLRTLWTKTDNPEETVRNEMIAIWTGYPSATVARLMQDFRALKLVEGTAHKNAWEYRIAPAMRQLMNAADLYTDVEEQERPQRSAFIRLRRPRSVTPRKRRRSRPGSRKG